MTIFDAAPPARGSWGLGSRTIVDRPAYKAETDALLARFADQPPGPDLDPYQALLLDREELPDPSLAGSIHPAVHSEDLTIGSLAARMYRPPTDEPRPVLLWLHGGGFIGGDLRDIECATSGIAAAGNIIVVSLNYRLAPENPYPAALHDVRDSLEWIREHQAELNGDGRIAVGGQSAGAALAAGACLLARDEGRPLPDRQLLCYPSLDLDQDTESYRLFDGTFLSIAPGRWSSAQYFPTGQLPATAVPLRAESLKDLPPALILAAGRDPLRDDARNYAARLEKDDVPVRLVEYAGTMHAFLNFPAVLSAARHAIELIGADLRAAFPAP
jgi:acetyl esterase